VAVKRGLGKGLSALLPPGGDAAEFADAKPGVAIPGDDSSGLKALPASADRAGPAGEKGAAETYIPLDKLAANPNQPRKRFNEEDLAELADSIRQQGIIQPVIAEDAGDGTYTIIAGERRVRAARMAGLAEAPVILRKYSEEKRMEVSLIENIQRSNLDPIEEASAYRQLMELEGLSQDDVAAKVGKNRVTVANALRLLKLPKEMQESVQKAELSPGHARAILSAQGGRAQEALYREILKRGLSVREAEKLAAASGSRAKEPPKPAAKGRAPELGAMEEKFISRLGTKVAINGDLNRGAIVVDYYSMEDLERLYELLGGQSG
jgi:ParB family chromosome partitioning protein